MGSGASLGIGSLVHNASLSELEAAVQGLDADSRQRLTDALFDDSNVERNALQVIVEKVSGEVALDSEFRRTDTLLHVKSSLILHAAAPPERQQSLLKGADLLDDEHRTLGDIAGPGATNLTLTLVLEQLYLSKVHVRSGDLIDKLVFHYSDGTEDSNGTDGGIAHEDFVLEAGEFIVELHVRHGDSLDAVKFVTNRGRGSQLYGNPHGGSPFTYKAYPGNQIWTVERPSSGFCPCLAGIVERPVCF